MARLPRPHIPLAVRCRVAMRQLGHSPEVWDQKIAEWRGKYRTILNTLLSHLANRLRTDVTKLHLDHDPALENRQKVYRRRHCGLGEHIGYVPDANDPLYLVYRVGGFTGSEHDIKTRVRGEHGQLSDHALARKEKRRQRKLTGKRKRTNWPKGRKLQSRNTFRRSK